MPIFTSQTTITIKRANPRNPSHFLSPWQPRLSLTLSLCLGRSSPDRRWGTSPPRVDAAPPPSSPTSASSPPPTSTAPHPLPRPAPRPLLRPRPVPPPLPWLAPRRLPVSFCSPNTSPSLSLYAPLRAPPSQILDDASGGDGGHMVVVGVGAWCCKRRGNGTDLAVRATTVVDMDAWGIAVVEIWLPVVRRWWISLREARVLDGQAWPRPILTPAFSFLFFFNSLIRHWFLSFYQWLELSGRFGSRHWSPFFIRH